MDMYCWKFGHQASSIMYDERYGQTYSIYTSKRTLNGFVKGILEEDYNFLRTKI